MKMVNRHGKVREHEKMAKSHGLLLSVIELYQLCPRIVIKSDGYDIALNVPILFQEIKEKPDPPKPAARAPPQRAPPVRIKQERFNPEYSTPSPGYGMFRDAIFPNFVGFPTF